MPGAQTLQILIEADSTGLTTQLMTAQRSITQFVSQMNAQEVDWTSILSKTISPAIITGIASLFADALIQSVQFQQSQADLGAQLGLTGDALANTGTAAQSIAVSTGASVSSIQGALQSLLPVMGGSLPDAQQAATDAAELSQMGFGSLSDIVSGLTSVMQVFGVTTGAGAEQILTALMNSAQASGESIPTIISGFSQFDGAAKLAGATVADLPDILDNFAVSINHIGLSAATDQFSTFTTAATGANPQLNAFVGSAAGLASDLKNGNVAGGLDQISGALGRLSPLLAANLGLGITPAVQTSLRNYSDEFSTILPQVQAVEAGAQTIAQVWATSDNAVRDLQKDWQAVQVALTSGTMATVVQAMATAVGTMLTDLGPIVSNLLPPLETLLSGAATDAEMLATMIAKVWTTLSGQTPLQSLDDIGNALKALLQTMIVLNDFFQTGLDLIGALGTALTDVFQGKWTSIGADMAKTLTGEGMDQLNQQTGTDLNNLVTTLSDPSTLKGLTDIAAVGSLGFGAGALAGATAIGGAAVSDNVDNSLTPETLSQINAPGITNMLQNSSQGFSSSQISKIENAANNANILPQLLQALSSGATTSSSSYAALKNTFNITAPSGATNLTANQIAAQLYKQFQGN